MEMVNFLCILFQLIHIIDEFIQVFLIMDELFTNNIEVLLLRDGQNKHFHVRNS